jgi:hypothetical protein
MNTAYHGISTMKGVEVEENAFFQLKETTTKTQVHPKYQCIVLGLILKFSNEVKHLSFDSG